MRREPQSAEAVQIERIRRAQSGDLGAFEELFHQYERGVYNVIFQMVRAESEAADLTQDTFIRAWKALPRLDAPEAFTTWLFRIATNLTRNWIRDNRKVRVESLDQPVGDEEGPANREVADNSANPADLAQSAAVQEIVQQAIGGLSDDHRMVVTLHHIQGMPVEEIARIMKCSVGTVKSRLSRARENLRRRLSPWIEG